MPISHDIICGDYGKNLSGFRNFFHVRCLQMETSANKNQRVEKDTVRFGVKVTIEFGFDFEFFSLANRQFKLFHVNFLLYFEAIR